MKPIITLLLLNCLGLVVWAQGPLSKGLNRGNYTYVYRLTDASVKLFYSGNHDKMDERIQGAPVDSFRTGTYKAWHLPPGNYIEVYAAGNSMQYKLIEQRSARLELMDDARALRFVVLDTNNNPVKDAVVYAGLKLIPYNASLGYYYTARRKKDTLLRIFYQGVSNFYAIRQNDQENYNTYNTYNQVKRTSWLARLWASLTKSPDKPHQNLRYQNPQSNPGYMVFNKPKFKPGDTVKLKAFLVSRGSYSPVPDKRLVLKLKTNYYEKGKVLGYVNAYRPGAFEYSFKLADSLKLRLDQSYFISLETADNPYDLDKDKAQYLAHCKVYDEGTFQYEDYELKSIKFNARVDKNQHAPGMPVSIYMRAVDDNGLDVPDGRVTLIIRTQSVSDFEGKHLFVPDTLWQHQLNLDPVGETKFTLPDSIFPKASISYNIHEVFLNSNNERREQNQYISYNNEAYRITHQLDGDTLKINYFKFGKPRAAKAMLYGLSEDKDTLSRSQITLPAAFKIDPAVAIYEVEADSVDEEINTQRFDAQFRLKSKHTADSLLIDLSNPLHLQLWYSILAGDKVIEAGTGTTLSYHQAIKSKEASLVLNYMWSGKMQSREVPINFADKSLTVDVKSPETVYPGQQAEIKVHVTDAKGAPVAGADLTAYALTAKFEDYRPPTVPYLGKQHPLKNDDISLQINEPKTDGSFQLNWQRWSRQMGLDSLQYYKFTHPAELYQIAENEPDTTAQIAPFIVKDGDIVPVHILFIDGIPVYFSKTNNMQRYSFVVKPGVHNLLFRTAYQSIQLKGIDVPKNKKLILSLNADTLKNKRAIFKAMPDTLTSYEADLISKYLISIVPNFRDRMATITQYNRLFLFGGNSNYMFQPNRLNNFYTIGPLFSNGISFEVKTGMKNYFLSEPGYSFQLTPGLIKQKSLPAKYPFTMDLLKAPADVDYTQYALTTAAVDTVWQNYLDMRAHNNYVFNNSYRYSPGTAPLRVKVGKLVSGQQPFVKSIIVFKYDDPDFMDIYPGMSTDLTSFEPGSYRVMYLFKGNSYFLQENVVVKRGGRNLYNTGIITPHVKDSTSIKIAALIDGHQLYDNSNHESQLIKEVFNTQYLDADQLKGEISGYVYDQKDKTPIPGANIRVRGIQKGAVTDANGFFRLRVPKSGHLVITALGYIADEVPFKPGQQLKFYLNQEARELREVAITLRGTNSNGTALSINVMDQTTATYTLQAKDVETLKASTIDQALQGRLAGVVVYKADTALYRAADYKVRSNASIDELLQKLEGFEVGADGSITAQGRAVTRVRLNGKDYAGGNLNEVMKALPADVIENIQMVDDYGDQAMQTGIKSGDPQKTLNVTTSLAVPLGKMLVINTRKGFTLGLDDPALLSMQSIRKNFSDYAYWQPKLITDAQGNASFKTTFPDDITSWRTFVLAMTGDKQSGMASGEIKSYKPLSANFAAPQFAVRGDILKPIGKVLNYTDDTIRLKRTFKLNDGPADERNIILKNSLIDTFQVNVTTGDSLKFEYTVKKDNGYFDGEQRSIPIFEQGTLETKGTFAALERDTTLTIQLDPTLKDGIFHAEASVLPALLDEAQHLRDYEYLCNEQLASKLLGLLTEKKIRAYLGEPFKYDKNIIEIIKKLQENRRAQGTWGWWKDTDEELWISLHAATALLEAEKQGFKITLDKQKLIDYLLYQSTAYSGEDKLTVLLLLRQLGYKGDYASLISVYTKQLNPKIQPSLYDKLRLMLVKQQNAEPFVMDTLTKYMHSTMFGNAYWGNEGYGFFDNSIQESVLVYQLLRLDGKHPELLAKIRNYFLEQRKAGYWNNTYQSAQILETILPDLLVNGKKPEPSVITLSGDKNETVTKFPYSTPLSGGTMLTVKKTGTMPVYITAYQKFWNPALVKVSKDFTVDTRFEKTGSPIIKIKGGETITLKAEVTARADADYVMVEIPIPAGCSYLDKTQAYGNNEVHREYVKNKVSIFCRKLNAGKHEFSISLTPRYGGTYQVNPAKAEMMYFPVFYGREGMKVFSIE